MARWTRSESNVNTRNMDVMVRYMKKRYLRGVFLRFVLRFHILKSLSNILGNGDEVVSRLHMKAQLYIMQGQQRAYTQGEGGPTLVGMYRGIKRVDCFPFPVAGSLIYIVLEIENIRKKSPTKSVNYYSYSCVLQTFIVNIYEDLI